MKGGKKRKSNCFVTTVLGLFSSKFVLLLFLDSSVLRQGKGDFTGWVKLSPLSICVPSKWTDVTRLKETILESAGFVGLLFFRHVPWRLILSRKSRCCQFDIEIHRRWQHTWSNVTAWSFMLVCASFATSSRSFEKNLADFFSPAGLLFFIIFNSCCSGWLDWLHLGWFLQNKRLD